MKKCIGFLVSWFQNYQMSIPCFLEDIDLISKISKMLLDGPSGFFGVANNSDFPKLAICINTNFENGPGFCLAFV